MTDSTKLTIIAIGTSITGLLSLITLTCMALFFLGIFAVGSAVANKASSLPRTSTPWGTPSAGAPPTSPQDMDREREEIKRRLNSKTR